MTGLRDLLASERGTFAMLILVVATALLVLGPLTSAQWLAVIMPVTLALLASKTIRDSVPT